MRQVSAAKSQDASGLPTETLYRGDVKPYFGKKIEKPKVLSQRIKDNLKGKHCYVFDREVSHSKFAQ